MSLTLQCFFPGAITSISFKNNTHDTHAIAYTESDHQPIKVSVVYSNCSNSPASRLYRLLPGPLSGDAKDLSLRPCACKAEFPLSHSSLDRMRERMQF